MKKIKINSDSVTKFGFFLTAISLALIAVFFSGSSKKTVSAETPLKFQTARWNETPQIFGARRGNPWINVQDGKEILTDFTGAETDFENNQPLSMATADFDEDGMPDIVIGYANGAASFMRGNVDAVYPNAPEAKERKARGEFTDASFLSPAQIFTLPATPDFLAAGDFDADGHFDIATAKRSENAVYFLRGNGKGGFEFAKKIELVGNVTAFLADDFNRRDGLNDLIVAVEINQKGQLLVFENPYGAMKAVPEIFNFDTPISSVAINLIEGDARFDLAITAGNELAILRGRDRKLLFDESGKQAEAVQLTRRKFDFQIDALAVGDFIKDEFYKNEIALLSNDGVIHLLENGGITKAKENLSALWRDKETISLPNYLSGDIAPVMLKARVSARSIDTLIVGTGSRIHLLTSDIKPPKSETEAINYDAQKFELAASLDVTSRPTAILPMRLNIDALSDLVVLREDSVAPTIVQTAPMSTFTVDSNANANDPRLGDGICAINPCPIDGNLPCTGPCTYWAAREQANFNGGSSLINFSAPSSVFIAPQTGIITALTVDGTTQAGGFIEVNGTASFPATHRSGNAIDSCVFRGIVANGSSDNYYIAFGGSNSIAEGNRLGTNAAGTAVLPNGAFGVTAGFANNLIGGTTAAARNIISTGIADGIDISNLANGGTNRVQGNFVGTDVTGTIALGNRGFGVRANGDNILVGGTTAGAGNVISGTTGDANFGGVGINPSGSIGVLVQGNRIGTNASGTAALPNTRNGIYLTTNGSFDSIGGIAPTARNLISGNGEDGLELNPSASTLSQVLGNYIGTNAAGTAAIPNGGLGLEFNQGTQKLISNNLISGNLGGGLQFCCNNGGDLISGNRIGTDITGNNPLGNGGVGLSISSGGTGGFTQNSTIIGNIIAANSGHGIFSDNSASLIFQNNFIGTNSSLSQTMGNGGDGMRAIGAFRSSQIGGAGAGNTIAFNAGNGINLAVQDISSTENRITGNAIFSNGGLGIDLGGDGVTANDECDGENGVNTLQNYPIISAVSLSGASNVRIVGTINTTANQSFTLTFYANQAADASGFGEGRQFIGTTGVAVPAGCQANFSATVPRTLAGARCISATATDSLGNTSEFSRCVRIRTVANSFDNDGKADVSIFRPSNGQWWFLKSSDGTVSAATFGASTDRITPGDFTGDGVTDMAFWRPSTGQWFVLRSEDFSFFAFPFGANGDIPAPGDYDGDGKFDAAVFRPAITTWFILRSSDGQTTITSFGATQDKPVIADYDGDGLDDIAIFRPNVGEWWYRKSSDGGVLAVQFGASTDSPVQGDWTGDGKADFAFWRPSTGFWFVLRSEDFSFFAFPWGANGDIPAPSDYDGDGRTDAAVFRPSNTTWFVNKSTDGVTILNFGLTNDKPVASAYIP